MPNERAINAFSEAVRAVEQTNVLYGFIGKLDSSASGGVVIDVPGRPGYVYVRISNGLDVQSVMEAYNAGGHRNPNVKVRILRRDQGLVIEAPVASSAIAFLGERAAELSIPPHSHAIGSGNVDMVEGGRFVPGLVRPATGLGEPGGLYVYVEPFHYDGGYWYGGTFLMTPPATSGKKAWCVVALNPATDTLSQHTGADQPSTIPMSPLLIADIAIPAGYFPLGAVVLLNGQTSITGAETWDDCRYHFSRAGSTYYQTVKDAGSAQTQRAALNLIEGANVTLSFADDAGNNETDLTIAATPTHQALFALAGVQTAQSWPLRIYNATGGNFTLQKVFLSVSTAPTGASLIVDVNINGTTAFTTQANRPAIVASAFTGESSALDVTAWNAGDYLTVDVDQIGSTIAGSDLTVHVVYK